LTLINDMEIEVIIRKKESDTRPRFVYCYTCPDINDETGDSQSGPLSLSGDGASIEEAVKQAREHQNKYPDHKVAIE
jgi:hypothetical protein